MNNKWERLQSATRYSAAAAEKLNAAWKALFEMDNLLLDVEAIVSTMSKLVPGGVAGADLPELAALIAKRQEKNSD